MCKDGGYYLSRRSRARVAKHICQPPSVVGGGAASSSCSQPPFLGEMEMGATLDQPFPSRGLDPRRADRKGGRCGTQVRNLGC